MKPGRGRRQKQAKGSFELTGQKRGTRRVINTRSGNTTSEDVSLLVLRREATEILGKPVFTYSDSIYLRGAVEEAREEVSQRV